MLPIDQSPDDILSSCIMMGIFADYDEPNYADNQNCRVFLLNGTPPKSSNCFELSNWYPP